MKAPIQLTHEFVRSAPAEMEEHTLYVSMEYASVVHKCCCGCGNEVVTPLSPADWTLVYDGKSVSLLPSIGNWSFKCRSHYWIQNGIVHWADQWSQKRVAVAREHDRQARERNYDGKHTLEQKLDWPSPKAPIENRGRGFWVWFSRLWSG